MRRKHKRRYTVIALLLLLGVSGAAALAMLPGSYGSGNYGNLAFLPEQLLSVFKKAEPPIGGQPQTSRTYAAYQPGEIPELNELPIDEPATEFVDGDVVQEASLVSEDGTTNIPKGGPGQPPQNNGQPNVGDDGGGAGGAGSGGAGGGGGGGTSANRMMASLVTTPEEKACEGEACVAECTGEDCVAECTGEDCIAKCEGEDCIAKCEGADCVAQCEGTACTTQCEGTDCTTENNGNTETADDTSNPGTCTGPNCDGDEQLAGCVTGEPCEPVCDELTSLSDTACIDPKEDSIPTDSESTVAVDEPGPLSLLLIGALGLALARRRAKRNAKSRSDV